MNRTREELLMRYRDGDVTDAEAAEVEHLLQASSDARGLYDDFDVLGGVLRSGTEGASRGDDIADSVMARIEAEAAPGADGRVRGLSPRALGGTRGGRRWAALVPAGGLVLAAAAAVALYFRAPVVQAPSPPPVAAIPARAAERPAEPSTAAASSSNGEAVAEAASPGEEAGAEIEAVDFGGHDGSIFMVAHGPDVTPVVWLMDDSPASKDRMAPL